MSHEITQSPSPRGDGFTILTHTIASDDYAGMMVAQRNLAGDLYGLTPATMPGRTDAFYPKVTGDMMRKLIIYWLKEIDRTTLHAEDIPDSAIRDRWLIDSRNFVFTSPTLLALAGRSGGGLVTDATAIVLWQALDRIVLPMKGIRETPTKFELALEAIMESFKELADRGESGLMKLAKIAIGVMAGGFILNAVVKK